MRMFLVVPGSATRSATEGAWGEVPGGVPKRVVTTSRSASSCQA